MKYFARSDNGCIYFCIDASQNDFTVCYVIYNCLIERMSIKVPEWDRKDHQAMIIRHQFDADYLLVVFEEENHFDRKLRDLSEQSLQFSKESMETVDQTNMYAFGKIHLKINGIDGIQNIGKIFIRIRFNPFFLETRKLK